MDDFAKEVITKMETCEKKEKRQFNKYNTVLHLIKILKINSCGNAAYAYKLIREVDFSIIATYP